MSEKNIEQIGHYQNQDIGNLKNHDESNEAEKTETSILNKLIDFDKQKDVAITTFGFSSDIQDAQFISGLLSTEHVLTSGLLSKKLSQRANKPISRYGFFENIEDTWGTKEDRKYLYAIPLNEERQEQGDEDIDINDVWHGFLDWDEEDEYNEISSSENHKEKMAEFERSKIEKYKNLVEDANTYRAERRLARDSKWDLDEIINQLFVELRKDGEDSFKKWFIVFDTMNIPKESNIFGTYNLRSIWVETDWGLKIPKRIKPERIMGIMVDEDVAEINIRDYFNKQFDRKKEKEITYDSLNKHLLWSCYSTDQIYSMEILCTQLGDCVATSNIEFSKEEKDDIERKRQLALKSKKDLLHHVNSNQGDQARVFMKPNLKWNTGFSDVDEGEFNHADYLERKADLQNKLFLSNLNLTRIYFEKLSSCSDFKNFETVGQYLIHIGKKYGIPIYQITASGEKYKNTGYKQENGAPVMEEVPHFSIGLYWPRKMTSEEIYEYIEKKEFESKY